MRIGRDNDGQVMGRLEQALKRPVEQNPRGAVQKEGPLDVTESPGQPIRDTVELSSIERAGQELFAAYDVRRQEGPQATEKARTTAPSDETKLEKVRHRIDSGFYDRADVKERIAHRLADELAGDSTELGEFED